LLKVSNSLHHVEWRFVPAINRSAQNSKFSPFTTNSDIPACSWHVIRKYSSYLSLSRQVWIIALGLVSTNTAIFKLQCSECCISFVTVMCVAYIALCTEGFRTAVSPVLWQLHSANSARR